MFTFFFAETEDDDGIVVLEHDHFDDFVNISGCCSQFEFVGDGGILSSP